jgi:hypothetical protein
MKNVNTYTLSDNVVVEVSDRKSNRSGYKGAAFSPAWTLDVDRPFIAACGNPSDQSIMSQLHAQERTAWHGGSYQDAREAAYVVSLFKMDPVSVDNYIHLNGVWDNFPSDLYDLPVFISHDEVLEVIQTSRATQKTVVRRPKIASVKTDDRMISKHSGLWADLYNKYDGGALTIKFGKELMIRARNHLTVSEFVGLFGL